MLDIIISRFQNAIEILGKINPEDITKEQFKIGGSVRAYLEAFNDHLNLVLDEMDKVESMLNDIFA